MARLVTEKNFFALLEPVAAERLWKNADNLETVVNSKKIVMNTNRKLRATFWLKILCAL